jgi:structural maintenance of chromosome 4
MIVQEVKAAAAEAVKNLAAHKKQQVGLEERSKHAKSKARKLEKDVSCCLYSSGLIFSIET